ncbi:sugar phosphate isomerase/epimerase family protein [Botrimarina hoheduenensis]|uniref:Xylose isomerase-like TIM barrel n=1 Tax=Botrimarina hoheduenensis TaxID=2528000 RepID=A0A5C5VUW4_9BACT|nr:sugar phosphate isomerase/epimerase family protein [Botrimarina hoheduenensis]TWT41401.1 Xylose isomerase-like TIM barrel [Botrimarina hoheduenensis]
MSSRPLGVFASIDAGLGVHLDVVHELGVPTIHLHTPQATTRTEDNAARFRDRLSELGIQISVVFAGFEGESYADIPTTARTVGLAPAATRSQRLEELKEIADFARQLSDDAVAYGGGMIPVGLHIGFVPHDENDAEYQAIVAAARSICDHCAPHGQAVHLETGQEPAEVLLAFLEAVGRSNLFINFDPANMILYGCGEPLEALRKVGPYVKSVHCKDATGSDQPGVTWGVETPLGAGEVDFRRFIAVLDEIGYRGPLTIEREIPQEPSRQKMEIGTALDLLRTIQRERLDS